MVQMNGQSDIQAGGKYSNMMDRIRSGFVKLVDGRNGPEQFWTASGLFTQLTQGGRRPRLPIPNLSPYHAPLTGIDHIGRAPKYQKTSLPVHYGIWIHIYQFI